VNYQVLDERQTIEHAVAGQSLARFGDGELRLALGGEAKSQQRNRELSVQLRQILREPGPALVCIPRHEGPKKLWWEEYQRPKFTALYEQPLYGSAFISRPDSAPWIDTPEYWSRVSDIWKGRDVVLMRGGENSLRPEQLAGAESVTDLIGPPLHAFASIEALMRDTVRAVHRYPQGLVLLCLGATATVMAWRLAQLGRQAIDIGHIGMFMRHQGAFRFAREELISNDYCVLNAQLHCDPAGYGGSGYKHAESVFAYAREIGARAILDYGAGEATLRRDVRKLGWKGAFEDYDPALPLICRPPKPADLVVCTDVLEHVEPEKLPAVLDHLRLLMGKGGYFVIATRAANKLLPDGRNAHLQIQRPEWWVAELVNAGLRIVRQVNHKEREVRLWVKK